MSNPHTPEDQNDFNTSTDNNNNSYPKYKGVRKRKWGKWVSEIRMPNSRERIWLGSFDSPRKAAKAFDAAQFCLRGPHAGFNFPDSLPDIPGGGSLSPHQIQAVATRFANDDENVVIGPPQTVTGQEAINQDLSSFGYSSASQNPSYSDYATDCSFMDILDNRESSDNNNNSGFNYDSFDHFFSGQLYTMHSGEEINYGDDDPHYQSSSSLWNF